MEHETRNSLEQEATFKQLMDPLPLMVRASGLQAELQFRNTACLAYSGNIESWTAGIHPDFREVYEAEYAAHVALKQAFTSKYPFSRDGQSYRTIAEQAEPWYAADGQFLGFLCYTIDIAESTLQSNEAAGYALEREQALNEELEASNEELSLANERLQRSEQQLRQTNNNLEQILNMLPASVVIIRGYDLIVELINTSNLLYWQKNREEVLGKPFLEILPDLADQPFAGQLRRVMETGETIDIRESPVLFTNPDGSMRETFVDYTYQPLSDLNGNRTGVLVMSFEITERVQARRLLEKYVYELAETNERLRFSNEELALSEARFKYLIQEAPVAIGVLHQRELIVESANNKVLEAWGKSRDIIGLPLSKALPELQGQPFLEILDQVYTTGQPFYANEIRSLLEHDGELKEIFFNVTYKPVFDSSGTTADILVVAVDVTEQVNSRKRVEESEQHFRLLADTVPAKISNALPSGEVTFFNKQWLEFAGMGFEDLRDFGYHQLMHPDEIPAFQAGLAQAAASGQPYVSEMRFKDLEGNYVWHLNIASPILDEAGNITRWVGSTTDIQTLKAEDQRKSDFVSMLSHELKTPVTSIKGHVQLLLRVLSKEGDSVLGNKLRPSLSRIDQLLVRLTGLIGDMLNMTRIEAGRLDLHKETILLSQLAEEVVADFRLSHQQHVIRLQTAPGVQIFADRHKITQVLINLIENAIKYAPESHIVDFRVNETAEQVEIQVQDYGIGIQEKDQQKIFERFYRVEGRNEMQYSGFGIGLYLVKSIVEYHGGSIKLESARRAGSTFTVFLPK